MSKIKNIVIDDLNKKYMNTRLEKPFTVITSNDDKIRFWIPRPTDDGVIDCVASFNIIGYLPFVDALQKLPYILVKSVAAIDENMSNISIVLTENNCFSSFIEDLPELLYAYVECHDKHQTIHSGEQ